MVSFGGTPWQRAVAVAMAKKSHNWPYLSEFGRTLHEEDLKKIVSGEEEDQLSTVSGSRRSSVYLPQGRLKIPWFNDKAKEIKSNCVCSRSFTLLQLLL